MGRKSTLRRLQPEIQAEINRILSEGRLTLDELLEHLRGIGVEASPVRRWADRSRKSTR